MKKEFIGYYDPTEKEINDSWRRGTFANTLLNLYRYTDLTRKDFLSTLKALKDALFLPHQAAREFHTNRIGLIEGIENSYSELYNIFPTNFEKNLEPRIDSFKKHPSIITNSFIKLHCDFLKKVSSELEKQKKNHPDFKNKNDVLLGLTELFENAIGKEFTKEELRKIYEEGKNRYSENIPPGFKDSENKQKKGERNVYGDLIIWKELINKTIKEKKPLIFVTDDRKEDWWTIENGKTIRPREELIKEFFDCTGIRILIYNADNFLHYAKEEKLVPQLKETTIREVKGIRISDEKSYSNIHNLIGDQVNFGSNQLTVHSSPDNQVYLASTGYNIPGSQVFLSKNPSEVFTIPSNQVYLTHNDPLNAPSFYGSQSYLANNPIAAFEIKGNKAILKENPLNFETDLKPEIKQNIKNNQKE